MIRSCSHSMPTVSLLIHQLRTGQHVGRDCRAHLFHHRRPVRAAVEPRRGIGEGREMAVLGKTVESRAPAGKRRRRLDRAWIGRRTLLWALNLAFLLFFLFPFYWQTVTALKPPQELYAQPVVWFPSHLYWGHF